MAVKVLPLHQSPIVGLQYLAYPLAVSLQSACNFPWFYSNFIQLEAPAADLEDELGCDLTFSGGWFDDNPCLTVEMIHEKNSQEYSKTIQNIKNRIDDGYYVFCHYDEFFVPYSKWYMKTHRRHDFLLYGYNDSEAIFNLYVYTERALAPITIAYKTFYKAFKDDLPRVYQFFKLNSIYTSKLDLCRITMLIQDYCQGSFVHNPYKFVMAPETPKVYGIKTYDFLDQYLRICQEDIRRGEVRPFHVLWEHKKCWKQRIQYLKEHTNLNFSHEMLIESEAFEKKALILRNMFIKASMVANSPEVINGMRNQLLSIKQQEEKIMDNLLIILEGK